MPQYPLPRPRCSGYSVAEIKTLRQAAKDGLTLDETVLLFEKRSKMSVGRKAASLNITGFRRGVRTRINATGRQLEVLALLAKGLLNKQIAYELNVNEGTVKSHISSLNDFYHTTNRWQLALYYLNSLDDQNLRLFLAENT